MAAMVPTKINNGIVTNFLLSAGDFLDITLGGTGAVTAAAARTNLGLAIGTNVEAWSVELDGLAGLSSLGFVTRTAAGTYTNRTNTAGAANTLTITNGNGVSGNPTYELSTITQGSTGTSFVKVAINSYGQITNNTAVTTADITALVNGTYVALAGSTMTGPLILSGDPTVALGAATKQYVDALATGSGSRATAQYATTAALPANTYNNGTAGVGATLTGTSNGALAAQDGQTVVAGNLILVKNEATTANNGLYVVTTVGTGGTPYVLTRSNLAQTGTQLSGMLVAVDFGTVNSGSLWLQTTTITTVGTTSMTWTEINKAADIVAVGPLTITGNSISIATNGISNSLIRQSAGLSVVGNTGNTTANVGDITGTASTILAVNAAGTSLSFTTLTTAMIGASQVTYAKLQNESNATILGNNSGGSAAPSEITVGTGLAFTSTTALGVATNGITNALFRQGGALTVVGVTGNATSNVADIAATASSGAVLRESGGTLGFGTISSAGIGASQITYAKIQNESAGTILGNGTVSSAAPQEITPSARFALSTGALDLAASGVTAQTYGSGTLVPVITVDTYGRITSATTTALSSLPVATVATTTVLPTNTYNNGASGVGATLTATSNGTLVIDGYTTALNDYVLVKNQASAFQNGLYQVTTAGAAGAAYVLTRVSAMNSSGTFSGVTVTVNGTGTINGQSLWLCTNIGAVTVGTTNITFSGLNKGNDITATTPVTLTNNAIGLAANGVTGAYFRQSAAISVVGNATGATANVADITATATGQVLMATSGTTLGFSTIATASITNAAVTYAKLQNESAVTLLGNPTGGSASPSEITLNSVLAFSGTTLTVATNGITNAFFRQGGALTVVGVTGNATSNVADIAATNGSGAVLRESAGTLGFGTLTSAAIGASQITYAKIQNESALTLLGNPTGSSAAPSEITLGSGLSFTGSVLAVTQSTIMPVAAAATTAALPAGNYSNGTAGVGATFTVTATGVLVVDGYTTALNDYVLVKNQASTFQNGLYQVTTAGAVGTSAVLTRAAQMSTATQYSGQVVYVNGTGTVNAQSIWVCTDVGSITVGTTAVTFVGLNKGNDIVGTAPITITGNAVSIATNGISNTLIRQGSGLSVIGVTGNATSNVADIIGTASTILAVNAAGTALAFTTLTTAMIGASQVTYAKLQNESAGTILGNGTGGSAAPQEITPTARFALSSGALDLATTGVTAGTYDSVTVDAYGRVTAATTVAPNTPTTFTAINGSGATMVIGTPVYISSSGTVNKSQSTSSTTAFTLGLVNDTSIASTASGNIACYGAVTATTGQWDAVAGTSGGLTAGTRYFVSATAGVLTSTIPTTGYLIEVGMALSSTIMILTVQQPIQVS